jgi:dUTP pyrophosphatase
MVLIQRSTPAIPLPAYAHPGDAGADPVIAADVELKPAGACPGRVPAIALPAGYAAFVHPRSGLGHRLG